MIQINLMPRCICGCNQLIELKWPYHKYNGIPRFLLYHSAKYYSRLGISHITEEGRKKLSDLYKGRVSPNKGKKLSEEHKRKIGKGNKGKFVSKETRKKMGEAHTGLKQSEETKKKMSETRLMLGISGDKHPGWKGGLKAGKYCYIWLDQTFKSFIKERDNHTCQNPLCWGTSNGINLHHIDYNKKNCTPENIITLCVSCNARANKNRNWWELFYTGIQISNKYGWDRVIIDEDEYVLFREAA